MAITRQKKSQILEELVTKFKGAKSIVFSQYKGISVKDLSALRKKFHEQRVDYKVAKKTLIRKAAKEIGIEDISDKMFEGPIGVAFGMEDELAPAKVLSNFSRDHECISITGAIFESKLISAADARALANIPSREILLTQLVGLFMSPIAGFHGVLKGLMRNFVYALSEVQKKKGN